MSCFQDPSLLELSDHSWLESPNPGTEKEAAAPTDDDACNDRGDDDLSKGGQCKDGSGVDHSGEGDDKMSGKAGMVREVTNLVAVEAPNLFGDGPQVVTNAMEKGAATSPVVVVATHHGGKEADLNVAVDQESASYGRHGQRATTQRMLLFR